MMARLGWVLPSRARWRVALPCNGRTGTVGGGGLMGNIGNIMAMNKMLGNPLQSMLAAASAAATTAHASSPASPGGQSQPFHLLGHTKSHKPPCGWDRYRSTRRPTMGWEQIKNAIAPPVQGQQTQVGGTDVYGSQYSMPGQQPNLWPAGFR